MSNLLQHQVWNLFSRLAKEVHQRECKEAQYQACPGGGSSAFGSVAQVRVAALVVVREVQPCSVFLPAQATLGRQGAAFFVQNQAKGTYRDRGRALLSFSLGFIL